MMEEIEYKTKRDNLFKKWEEEYQEFSFTHDGISDWKIWNEQDLKILFLLMEAHDDFEPSIPNQDIVGSFGFNLARWSELLKRCYKNPNEEIEFIENEYLEGKLDELGAALVEVKKVDEDKSTSNKAEINRYAEQDKENLKEEIELINPHVIFCCGTNESYEIIYDWKTENAERNKNYFVDEEEDIDCSYWIHNNRIIIYFYHPTARGKNYKSLFYLLQRMLKEGKVFEKIDFTKY